MRGKESNPGNRRKTWEEINPHKICGKKQKQDVIIIIIFEEQWENKKELFEIKAVVASIFFKKINGRFVRQREVNLPKIENERMKNYPMGNGRERTNIEVSYCVLLNQWNNSTWELQGFFYFNEKTEAPGSLSNLPNIMHSVIAKPEFEPTSRWLQSHVVSAQLCPQEKQAQPSFAGRCRVGGSWELRFIWEHHIFTFVAHE